MGHTTTRWAPRPEPTLEEMAAEAVRLGRVAAEGLRRHGVGGSGAANVMSARILAQLAEGQALDSRDEGSLDAVAGLLAGELAREALGEERVFVGAHHPEGEDIGDVETVTCYTDRGRRLAALDDTFRRYRRARQAVLDRVVAERALRRLLSM